MWLPMKPAPPVTRILCSADPIADPAILERERARERVSDDETNDCVLLESSEEGLVEKGGEI